MQSTHTYPADRLAQDIEAVGPRVYRLNTKKDADHITLFVIGCQGNGKEAQHQVAKLMDEVDDIPDIVLVLGDNLYDDGATSPNDPQFDSDFHDVYRDSKFKKGLKGAKFFLVLGNHDANLHKKTRIKKKMHYSNAPQGKSVAFNEVAHTYTHHDHLDESNSEMQTQDKLDYFKRETLNTDELDKWNMPYYFYSLILGDTQIFCLDSNTYAADFVHYQQHKDYYDRDENISKNQAAWFASECRKAKAAGRKIMIAQHHPFFTSGKRANPTHFDTSDYLDQQTLITLKKIIHCQSDSYNELLYHIFNYQQLTFDILFAAHDHCLQFYNEKRSNNSNGLCQITSGGGGGDLQKRTNFVGHENIGCYLKNNGFVVTQFSKYQPEETLIEFYSTAGHHLEFTTENHMPLCEEPSDIDLKHIRSAVINSVDEYFSLLMAALILKEKRSKENYNVTSFLSSFTSTVFDLANYMTSSENMRREDIDDINNLAAYLNQPTLPPKKDVVNQLFKLFEDLNTKIGENGYNAFSALQENINDITRLKSNSLLQNQQKISTIKSIANEFNQLGIPKSYELAESLITFVLKLTPEKHPFYTLVDHYIGKQFNKHTLSGLNYAFQRGYQLNH